MPFKLTIESRAVQADVRSWALPVLDKLESVLILVGLEVVAYLQSYTNEWRPPVGARGTSAFNKHGLTKGAIRHLKHGGRLIQRKEGDWAYIGSKGKRRAHPGHWADVTGDLKEKYDFRVVRGPESVTLEISNKSEHAIYVEAMDGFFVLKGITDKGGPLDQRLRAVLPLIAPTMEVV